MNGRPVEDPSMRIARLTEARKKYFKRGQKINMTELAAACGVTDRRMSQIVKEDLSFPIAEKGWQGKGYIFDAMRASRYLIDQAKKLIEEREQKSDLLAQLSGIQVDPALMPEHMSVGDLMKLAQAQRLAQSMKIEQGQYISAEDHAAVLAVIYETVQEIFMSVVTEADAPGMWPPDVSMQVADYHRGKAASFRELILSRLEKRGVSKQGIRRAVATAFE